jgi:diguanylate cyclase (GGDEF)-like protein
MEKLNFDLLNPKERRRVERIKRMGLGVAILVDTLIAVVLSLTIGTTIAVLLRFDGEALRLTLVLSFFVPLVARPISALRSNQLLLKLLNAETRLAAAARKDPLTGAYSKPYFKELVHDALSRVEYSEGQHTMIIFDIDEFKAINDKYGHLAGDHALESLGTAVLTKIRGGDLFGRFGGDEFMLFLPHHDQSTAMRVAERIRKTVADLQVKREGRLIPLTISLGITTVTYEQLHKLDEVLDQADKALLSAKSGGGNQINLLELPQNYSPQN